MSASFLCDRDLELARSAFRAEARVAAFPTMRYRLRYVVWGSGPPLVFIHGMADQARSFTMVMHRLTARFTCIAYELPDGTTDGSALARYTHEDYVADLHELLDHLGLQEVALIGSSFGTTIALAALGSPTANRFTHGILQGGFAHRPLTRLERGLCDWARSWPGWFGDWPALYQWVMERVVLPTYTSLTPAVWRFLLDNGGRTPIRAAAIRSRTIDRLDLRPLLPHIRQPVLLLGGDRDPLVPRSCERELEDSIPNAQRVEFPRCGHYPHFSHPGLMADAILEFLRT